MTLDKIKVLQGNCVVKWARLRGLQQKNFGRDVPVVSPREFAGHSCGLRRWRWFRNLFLAQARNGSRGCYSFKIRIIFARKVIVQH